MRKPLIIIILSLLCSCIRETNPIIIGNVDNYLSGEGVFILNEGNFRSGNGSLSFFSYDSLKLFDHIFLDINKRPLGDIPYSASLYGNRVYIVVNNSDKIEVADRNTLISVATFTKIKSPRYISFINDTKAYVTSLYSDSVEIIDLSSNSVSGYINLKHTSESIVTINSTSYVANWYGGNKIMLINTANNHVVDSIEVGNEPESMVIDKNEILWVLCNGGWKRENYAELIGINTLTNKIEKRFTFPSISDSPTCLQINGQKETLYYLLNGVRCMDINAASLPADVFIREVDHVFYKLGVNSYNNEIFATDAADYVQKGKILRYSKTGVLISEMAGDIIPGNMCFKLNPEHETE